MDDRRVHIYFENALKFIRRCEEEYDLIIVDSSDPFGPVSYTHLDVYKRQLLL